MSTFGLVHGGGLGAWCWETVIPELEARGHRAAAAFRRFRPEPGVLGKEVSPLLVWPDVPAACIVCADDRVAPPAWARRAARERLGVEPIEVPGGHCPMLSRPGQLAEALERRG